MELRYIIRFKEYKMADQHRSQLQQHLRGWSSQDWRWVARRNAAAKFPTDFALLELDSPNLHAVKVGPGVPSTTAVTNALGRPSRAPLSMNLQRSAPKRSQLDEVVLLQASIVSSPSVKDIHPEFRVTRSLAREADPEHEEKSQWFSNSQDFEVHKRPGR